MIPESAGQDGIELRRVKERNQQKNQVTGPGGLKKVPAMVLSPASLTSGADSPENQTVSGQMLTN